MQGSWTCGPCDRLTIPSMLYFASKMILFDFLRRPEIDPVSTPPDLGYRTMLESRSVAHALEMLPLAHIYRETYTLSHPVASVVQATIVSMSMLIRSLDQEDSLHAFSELCPILIAGARRWKLWRGVMGTLRHTAMELGVTLPADIAAELHHAERDFWLSQEYKQYSSNYPNYALARDLIEDKIYGLEDLLEKWARLQFEDVEQ